MQNNRERNGIPHYFEGLAPTADAIRALKPAALDTRTPEQVYAAQRAAADDRIATAAAKRARKAAKART